MSSSLIQDSSQKPGRRNRQGEMRSYMTWLTDWFHSIGTSSLSRFQDVYWYMEFSVERTLAVLANTPRTLRAQLTDLGETWTHCNEGGESWSAFDIVGHLIHGEKTDWIPRARIILADAEEKNFEPYDRFAQFEASKGKSLDELLTEFEALRAANLEELNSWELAKEDFQKTGVHPEFGEVTLKQLISTWMVHDVGHIAQINRVLAHQYKDEIGPWKQYLPIVR